jgi:glycosyltransferase involved in cell wall biosynthesis
MKKSLQDLAIKKGLRNVLFWPGQTHEKMPEIYALADICLVSLKNISLFNKFIPSKIFEIMASGRPLIACLGGEAAEILEHSGGAMVIPPGNPKELEQAIINLLNNNTLRQKMGENGVKYVSQHFSRETLAKKYENVLMEISNNKMIKKDYVPKQEIPK